MTKTQTNVCQKLVQRNFNPMELLDFFHAHGPRFWSWGASRYTNVNGKGLHFWVNGHHHKGYVLITLAWDDTFKVHIISNKGRVLDTFTDVYIHEIFDVIDRRVERIDEYII